MKEPTNPDCDCIMNTLGARTWVLPTWCLSWLTCWRRTFWAVFLELHGVKLRPCLRMVNGVATPAPWLEHIPSSWSAQKLCAITSHYSSAVSCWIFFHDACRSSHCLCLKSPLDRNAIHVATSLSMHTRTHTHTHFNSILIMWMDSFDGGQASFCGAVHQLARCGQAPGCATGEEAAIGSLKGTKSWEDKKIPDGTKQLSR